MYEIERKRRNIRTEDKEIEVGATDPIPLIVVVEPFAKVTLGKDDRNWR